VARKPENFAWLGLTDEQARKLDFLDHLGNNGWARNPQSEAILPTLLGELDAMGLPLAKVIEAMSAIGYGARALHQLERWESKRTTGRLGG
jgi:hypothetical protein